MSCPLPGHHGEESLSSNVQVIVHYSLQTVQRTCGDVGASLFLGQRVNEVDLIAPGVTTSARVGLLSCCGGSHNGQIHLTKQSATEHFECALLRVFSSALAAATVTSTAY